MLNNELAQKVVDSIIPIVSRNVNIMNENGIIIGSGNSTRIGAFHKVAYSIIQQPERASATGCVTSEEENMMPGVNLPIFFNNKVVGCVGITGLPEEVLTIAKLIQMNIQLLLWREYTSSKQDIKKMMMSEFINTTLSKKSFSEVFINELQSADLLYKELKICYIVVQKKTAYSDTVYLIDRLLQLFPSTIIAKYNQNIVIFSKTKIEIASYNDLHEDGIVLFEGSIVDSYLQLHKSYFIAHAMILLNSKKIEHLSYADSKLHVSIITNWLDYPYIYEDDLKKMMLIRNSKSLLETYRSYLKYNGVIKDICENLFIHRNSAVYRLNKISELTGLDIDNLEQSFRLFSLYVITELTSDDED